ncbi:phosphatidate cytidylyltransferase [bacterium]
MTELSKRIAVSIIGIIVFISAAHYGFLPFFFFMGLVIISALYEFYGLFDKMDFKPLKWLGMVLAFFLLLLFFLDTASISFSNDLGIFTNILLVLLVIMPFFFFLFKKDIANSVISIAITVFGVFYVGWCLGHFIVLRSIQPFGRIYVYYILVVVWLIDIIAYFVGRKFGTRKILPSISPKKSVIGSTAGFISAVLTSLMFKVFFIKSMSIKHSLILGIIIGIFAQAGDFSESLIKRNAGKKDSGTLLPGHGGVLDRFDSFIFVAPIVYYYIKIII